MARFLFTVWPVVGHVYPQIAIAQALRDRGHDCAFYTGGRVARIVEGEGFQHFRFRNVDEEAVYGTLFPPQRDPMHWSKPGRLIDVLRRCFVETIPEQVRDLDPILDTWKPDVIASDPLMWSSILVYPETRGMRVAVSSYTPVCILPGPDAPPFGVGFPRPRNWSSRLQTRAAYAAQRVMTRGFRRRVDGIRRQFGLPPLRTSVAAHLGTMPLYLVPGAPEFDFERRDLPPSVRYVGPLSRRLPPGDRGPDWVASLRTDRPWVYATEGTVHVSRPVVLTAAAEGLAGLPMEVVLVTGDDRDPRELDLGPLAPNIHVDRWVPYAALMSHTRLVITTGGPGSVAAAFSSGVPVIVVPTEWDKPDIAQRVQDSGAGLCLSPRGCTPARLRAAVERVLGDPSFRRNAERLGNVFKRYTGAAKAAELLEELVRPQPDASPDVTRNAAPAAPLAESVR